MPRLIHLVVKAEYVGPAHWAIYIPSQIDHRNGKLLHVGDTLKVEFVRNYTLPASNEVRSIALLGHIDDSDGNIVDFTACPGAPFVKDHVPQDTVEQIALTIPVPGLTRNTGGLLDCCQRWVYSFVNSLMANNIVLPADHSLIIQRLDDAPRR